jgi:hypothetical protein
MHNGSRRSKGKKPKMSEQINKDQRNFYGHIYCVARDSVHCRKLTATKRAITAKGQKMGALMSPAAPVKAFQAYAAQCVLIAEELSNPGYRAALLNMAQAWFELADHVEKEDVTLRVALSPQPAPPDKTGRL